jgi:transcriptional regulator with XRE-family HTH domain
MANAKIVDGSASMRVFGSVVRACREACGKTVGDLACFTGWSKSMVVKIERGERLPPANFVVRATEFLSAGGMLISAAAHIERGGYPSYHEDYIDLEQTAVSLCAYDTAVINGLLQTEDYARAVLGARCPILEQSEIDATVDSQLRRQELFTRNPPAQLAFVLDEPSLLRTVAGTAVQRAQLTRLLEVATLRNVTIQVLPFTCPGHAGLEGPMRLLETPDRERCAYVEVQGEGSLIMHPEKVSVLNQRYAMIRSQALGPTESAALIEKMLHHPGIRAPYISATTSQA